MSMFGSVELAAPDLIFGLNADYKNDANPNKINLLIGAYKTEEGQTYVLPVVRTVEKAMAADETLDHEYLPIEGMKELCDAAMKLALGAECNAIIENRVACVQSLSGTGAIRLALSLLNKSYSSKTVYLPKPTWGNHKKLCWHAGFTDVREYRSYDSLTNGVDMPGLLEDLEAAPDHSVVLLHACAQNPSGADPSQDEWKTIAEVVQKKKFLCIFDVAYSGFVSGDPDVDVWAVRYFQGLGLEFIFCQSFAKIFGLYNERCGNLGFVCNNSTIAMNVKSQLKAIIRPMYSNPPNHGARIVATILNNDALRAEWKDQLKAMANRITNARILLLNKLKEIETPGDWSHIMKQMGMFTFTGLTQPQVVMLREKYHIYMLPNGRINMCGVNESNVDTIVQAFKDVVVNVGKL